MWEHRLKAAAAVAFRRRGRRLDLRRGAQAQRRGLLLLAAAGLHGLLPRGNRRAAPDLAAARRRRRVRQGPHRLRRRMPPGAPHAGVRAGRGRRGGAAGAGDLVASLPEEEEKVSAAEQRCVA
ncbi:hypothetical protein PR202_gb04671 [Eleusine coracana subsp. coracana]|uniref:Uncharacterized protein n=1 Tax=Eleusine coracana subsp. coracana TaxID=191504 RepID=A0AAV5E5A4_ELECO|nr:hypothetical protein PR202_gb04671 [Eleusine coracana subsp. coracana]